MRRASGVRPGFQTGNLELRPVDSCQALQRDHVIAFIAADKDGGDLNGATTYRLNIPPNVPAQDFWPVVIYDPQTRSELQTSQPFPSKKTSVTN